MHYVAEMVFLTEHQRPCVKKFFFFLTKNNKIMSFTFEVKCQAKGKVNSTPFINPETEIQTGIFLLQPFDIISGQLIDLIDSIESDPMVWLSMM